MKMKVPHIIPLSTQAIKILEDIKLFTANSKYVFHAERTFLRPMSDAALNAALRRMGYSKEELVPHGFRHMASTLLHENGWNTDYIERQLAHAERNTVKARYNHAQYLDRRAEMMQWYADYLDELKNNK
jgi:integrase